MAERIAARTRNLKDGASRSEQGLFDNPRFVVIAGLPGSGAPETAEFIAKQQGVLHITDRILAIPVTANKISTPLALNLKPKSLRFHELLDSVAHTVLLHANANNGVLTRPTGGLIVAELRTNPETAVIASDNIVTVLLKRNDDERIREAGKTYGTRNKELTTTRTIDLAKLHEAELIAAVRKMYSLPDDVDPFSEVTTKAGRRIYDIALCTDGLAAEQIAKKIALLVQKIRPTSSR